MGKANEVLGLIASITEEGEGQGPLNLMVGAKVKVKQGDQVMDGEICAMDDGSCYNQAEDSYCVKVGDQMAMVKSADISMAETKAASQKPGKPNPYLKRKSSESEGEEGEVDKQASMQAAVDALKECYGFMREIAGDDTPGTNGHIDNMDKEADNVVPTFESELNLPNPDGGGAGDGGNQQDDGGNGTPA